MHNSVTRVARFAVALLCASAAWGLPVKVNVVSAYTPGGSATATTASTDFTGSTALYASVGGGSIASLSSTPTCGGLGWQQAGITQTDTFNAAAVFYCATPPAQPMTVSATGAYISVTLSGYSGATGVLVGAVGNVGGNIVTTPTITTVKPNTLFIGTTNGFNQAGGYTSASVTMSRIDTYNSSSGTQGWSYIAPTAAAVGTTITGSGGSSANTAIAAFEAAADYTVSGPGSTLAGVASTNITVTKASGTWNSTCQYSFSDGGHGTVYGGSVTGTSTGTYTPPSGSSFTFTVTQSTAQTLTITPTNNCGQIDPTAYSITITPVTVTFTSCPTTGTKNVASAACTVALNSGANFAASITITDGGNGGLVTPSVGAPCNTPCAVASGGIASFTFTYTAVVVGTLPLTTFNVSGYTNATAVNDVVTFAGTTYTAQAGTGNWNVNATWSPSGVPASGDKFIVPGGATVHVPSGYTAIAGTCPATSTNVDGRIDNGGALLADSGSIFRMQGNIEMNGTTATYTNMPILQYSSGATITPDGCNAAVAYGPFASTVVSNNVIAAGIDVMMVTSSGTTITRSGGATVTSAWNGLTGYAAKRDALPVAYTLSACSGTTCTVSPSIGTNASAILFYIVQTGALTSAPTTNITGINGGGAGGYPALFADPAVCSAAVCYSPAWQKMYGINVTNCGGVCNTYYLTNLSGGGLGTTDIENAVFTNTGGESCAANGSTDITNGGYVYIRSRLKFLSTFGASSLDPCMATGTPSVAATATISNVFTDIGWGNSNHSENGLCVTNAIIMAYASSADTSIASTRQWGCTWTNVVEYLAGGCSTSKNTPGSMLNYIFVCPTFVASFHITGQGGTSVNLAYSGGIYEADAGVAESHATDPSGATSTGTVAITNTLVIPSSNGVASASLLFANASTSVAYTLPAYTLTNNTVAGVCPYGCLGWTGHDAWVYPTGTWLTSAQKNISWAATSNASNYAIATPAAFGASGAPANPITAGSVDYNVLWNMNTNALFVAAYNANCNAGSTTLGTYYQTCNTVGTAGAHDIASTNPYFVDTTRTALKWAGTQGQAATGAGLGLAFSSADPSAYPALIGSLLGYVRAGFIPTNMSLYLRSNGATAGAVAMTAQYWNDVR